MDQERTPLGIEDDVDEILGRLAHAMRTDDPEDACAGLLETMRAGCGVLRDLPRDEAWRRVRGLAAILGVEAVGPGDPKEAAGLTPASGYKLPAERGPDLGPSPWQASASGRLPLQDELEALIPTLSGVPAAARDLLGELAAVRVPPDQGGARFFVALVRALDEATWQVRYTQHEAGVRARVAPVLDAAVAQARVQGARVVADASEPGARALPAFGAAGRVVWIDRHGFRLPDGRVEAAVLRVGRGSPPVFWDLLLEGYRAVRDAGRDATAYRTWLDELPGLDGAEQQATTLRYAATAVHGLAQPELYARFVRALEQQGSFPIPVLAHRLHDEERYDVLLEPGTGLPRLVRPGFHGPDGVVQQRARVVADPSTIGSGG